MVSQTGVIATNCVITFGCADEQNESSKFMYNRHSLVDNRMRAAWPKSRLSRTSHPWFNGCPSPTHSSGNPHVEKAVQNIKVGECREMSKVRYFRVPVGNHSGNPSRKVIENKAVLSFVRIRLLPSAVTYCESHLRETALERQFAPFGAGFSL